MVLSAGRSHGVIELGAAVLRYAELSRGRVRCISLRREEPSSPVEPREVVRLVRAARRRGAEAACASIVLPKAVVRVVPVDLPPAGSGAPVMAIAAAQAVELTGLDPGTFEVAVTAGGGDGASSVSVCRHEDACAIIEAVTGAGVVPGRVLPPAATLAVTATGPGASDETALYVDVGWSSTTMLVARGDRVLVDRHIRSLGFAGVVVAIRDSLRCDEATARCIATVGRASDRELASACAGAFRAFGLGLTREIAATVPFAARAGGEEPSRVLIGGGGGDDPELIDFLQASSVLPVDPLVVDGRSGADASLVELVRALARDGGRRGRRAERMGVAA